ncbi:tRNA (N(6)-L-threonylcarbamoyladenosine(37)-C(2))-methylthiotransferase MtaB [Peptoniphilus sp. EMRHCC_23]|uniref:tRNA (N(6)-L-threonylcarbamoyladenosine(37)-C(2))- methylthiotransferase MtaB n=1 Tax=Peptoniphilus rachelemmaiella TaxID=2811779 RepID=UPI001C0077A1|nr:tRNA (N(6)-L-threonylcarbamoyladenosine(37)-C(2))-methylthiotransferase MtaB [Peptoniphilus rachelemmaiella]
MRRFKTYTLGCKVNQYETEAVEEMLEKEGYGHDESMDVDLAIINTCTVTNESDRKSRQIIRRHKRENPQCKVVVIGCYAQVSAEEVAKIDGVDLILGTKDRTALPGYIDALFQGAEQIVHVRAHEQGEDFEQLEIKEIEDHTRAYMKVQDGCNQYCTYCIIPYARGFIRSRDMRDAVEEAKRLAASGFKEIVLTGIHVGSYGKDLSEDVALVDLIEAMDEVAGIERIRLSSIEPMTVTDDFLNRVAKLKHFMPHFHLSLQSGAEKTLREMNRNYTPEEYGDTVARILDVFPDAGLTTDVIVGFPGESEEDFRESMNFVEEMGFSRLHVFPYSMRKNTPAARRKDQIPGPVKKERAARMIALGDKLAADFVKERIGITYPVLFEEKKDGKNYGYTPNYMYVAVEGKEDLRNTLECVTIEGEKGGEITGRIRKEQANGLSVL